MSFHLDATQEVKPDYAGGSLVNLMQSIAQIFGVTANDYAPLRLLDGQAALTSVRNVVLWVIDGLGLEYLQAQGMQYPMMQTLQGGMTSVFPSTTASAVTTFLTGLAPQQHGLTGWHVYLRELGQIAAVLPFRPRLGGSDFASLGIDAKTFYRPRPFADILPVTAHIVSPAFIAYSPFNRAYSGRAQVHAYESLEECIAQMTQSVRTPGRNYVYGYWPEFDRLSHEHGVGSETVQAHYEKLNQAFTTLREKLSGTDTLLLVTADHGFIDVEMAEEFTLSQHPQLERCLRLPLSGERRAAYCYLQPCRHEEFLHYLAQTAGESIAAVASEELMAAGWFGLGTPHERLSERVGDVTLLMRGRRTIKDWLPGEKPYWHHGVHGGISRAEMMVPLLTVVC